MVTKKLLRWRVAAAAVLGAFSVLPPISARRLVLSLRTVAQELPVQRVEVSFVGAPPIHQVMRASGVSKVEVDGVLLRCLVCGSFQPFLEALRGHEVVSLTSVRSRAANSDAKLEGGNEW
jgi:hypothetical protein